jgi:hypothetical protein
LAPFLREPLSFEPFFADGAMIIIVAPSAFEFV